MLGLKKIDLVMGHEAHWVAEDPHPNDKFHTWWFVVQGSDFHFFERWQPGQRRDNFLVLAEVQYELASKKWTWNLGFTDQGEYVGHGMAKDLKSAQRKVEDLLDQQGDV